MKIPTEVGGYGLMDILIIGGSKIATEKLLSGVVGNGTVKSGLVKLATALGLTAFAGQRKEIKLASIGIGVDAIEDFVFGFGVGGFLQPTGAVQRI